jgi:hypothetical protein
MHTKRCAVACLLVYISVIKGIEKYANNKIHTLINKHVPVRSLWLHTLASLLQNDHTIDILDTVIMFSIVGLLLLLLVAYGA